jgi:HAD superfamily hydrolase (TIGR01509 family)
VSVPLPDPASVDTVLLDAGGVLVRPDFRRVAAALGARGVAVDPEALAAAELRAKREMDGPAAPGTDPSRDYFGRVLLHAGIDLSKETDAALADLRQEHRRRNLWDAVPADVGPALRRLGRGGRRLVVVSNSDGTVRSVLRRLGLASHFVAILDSAEEGVEKPDPRLFQIALERAAAAPEGAVHVGDLYHVDVVGARAAGIRAVLLDPGGLYAEVDCPRVRSLGELAVHIDGESSEREFC